MMLESPDNVLSTFHKYISKLDYYNDLDENKQSIKRDLEQDDNHQEEFKLERQESIESVPLKFSSASFYMELFGALFLYEAKAQILKAKLQEASEPELVDVVNLDLKDGFRYFTFRRRPRLTNQAVVNYPNGNLVIISPENIIHNIQPKEEGVDHILGFADTSNNELQVKLILDESLEILKPEKWAKFTTTREWYLQNLCAITTLEREYKALFSFNSIGLKQIIMNPQNYAHCVDEKFQIPQQLDIKLKNVYNQSQYKAIFECLKKTGITLIQGPPGTGKTKTVLGTISLLLNSVNKVQRTSGAASHNAVKPCTEKDYFKKHPWMHCDYVDWRDQVFLDLELDIDNYVATKVYEKAKNQIQFNKHSEKVTLPGKILICGPSNASVDQIIRKILKEGLLDSKGNTYNPSIIRVGDNFDSSLDSVSLDYLATQQMNLRGRKEDINFYRNKVLKETKIVCGTLSASGHQFIQAAGIVFDTVIIDQACQAVEVSTLIPLLYGCKRLILIGDPNQLPSTIFSRRCIRQGYEMSLFERMMRGGYKVNMLKTQYRMHPEISNVIGSVFYGGQINDSPVLDPVRHPLPINEILDSFIVFHVQKSAEKKHKNSFRNFTEAKAIKSIIDFLIEHKCKDVGVLSPYNQQISLILSHHPPKEVEVKTIDSFQGREKSIIIFNTVRAGLTGEGNNIKKNYKKTIGFLSDRRRVNVGLSRAKNLCIIVCDANRLVHYDVWGPILKEAMDREQIFRLNTNYKGYFNEFSKNKEKFRLTEFK